jgi:hypothetical protein
MRYHPFSEMGENDSSVDTETARIDMKRIREEITKLLLPHQELFLVHGVHDLGKHLRLSRAVQQALKTDTVFSRDANGIFTQNTVPYLDSAQLLYDMAHTTSDVLV